MPWPLDDQQQQQKGPARPVFTGSPAPQVGTIGVIPQTLMGRIAEAAGAGGGQGMITGGGSGGADTPGVTSGTTGITPSGGAGAQVGFPGYQEGGAQPIFDPAQGAPAPGGQGIYSTPSPSSGFDGMGAIGDWLKTGMRIFGGGGGAGGGAAGPGSVGGFAGPAANMDPGNQGSSMFLKDLTKAAMSAAKMGG